MFNRTVVSLLALGLSTPSLAATTKCDIFPTNTCASSVASVTSGTTPAGDAAAMAAVTMTGNVRLDVFAKVCDPTGWTLHLADSPTDDGYGGDAGTTDHDAEIYLLNYDVQFYSSYDWARSLYPNIVNDKNALDYSTFDSAYCGVVQMAFVNIASTTSTAVATQAIFDGDATNTYDTTDMTIYSTFGPRLAYTAATSSTTTGATPTRSIETDWEDKSLADYYKWYVGVNRVVNSALSRYGSGVTKACIVRSTTTAEPSSCI